MKFNIKVILLGGLAMYVANASFWRLEQIGIVIRNISGEILEELTPKPSR
jgi:hypothetical protein